MRQRLGLRGDRADRLVMTERQRDVFGGGQRLEEREMLEDHTDAEATRLGRAGDADGLSGPGDLASIRLQ
jgi:hypothetical protein